MLISGRPGARRTRSRLPPRAFGAAVLAILVAGCSSSPPTSPAPPAASPASTSDAGPSANPGATAGSAPSPGVYPFPDPAAVFSPTEPPIDLAVTPESGNTVTALIPAAGGELAATGADGTVYTLTIPDKALMTDTEISMTPVAAMKGLPTGDDVTFAVQLAPDGLHLEDFATLTITPKMALPIDQQVPFGYEAAGAGMFVALPVVNDPGVQLRILHFSGYGVTKGLLGGPRSGSPATGRRRGGAHQQPDRGALRPGTREPAKRATRVDHLPRGATEPPRRVPAPGRGPASGGCGWLVRERAAGARVAPEHHQAAADAVPGDRCVRPGQPPHDHRPPVHAGGVRDVP